MSRVRSGRRDDRRFPLCRPEERGAAVVDFVLVLVVTGGRTLRRTAGLDEHVDVPVAPPVAISR